MIDCTITGVSASGEGIARHEGKVIFVQGALLGEVVQGLGDGSLEPTAGALEPLADSVPEQ